MFKLLSQMPDNRMAALAASAVLLAVLAVFMPVGMFGIFQVVERGEIRALQAEVERGEHLLRYVAEQTDQTLMDWAFWDDTYRFALEGSPDYIESNLAVESIANLEIDGFVILNADHAPVLVKFIDRRAQVETGPPFPLEQLLSAYPILYEPPDRQTGARGIAVAADLPLLVASRPILTSLREGPPAGTLLFIRLLDAEALAGLSAIAASELTLHPAHEAAPGALEIVRLDPDTLSGRKPVLDLNGQPTAVLGVKYPRELHSLGRTTAGIFAATLLLLGLLLCGATYRFLRGFQRSRRLFHRYLRRFQTLVQQSNDAILLISPDFRILEANPASRDLLGWEPEKTQNRSLTSILNFNPELNSQDLPALAGSGAVSDHSCIRHDGRHLDVELTVGQVIDSGVEAYSVILRNVTIRKMAEEALKTSEERYMLAANGSNDGLWDWNLATGEVYYSARWKNMLGFSNDGVTATSEAWLDRVHPDDYLNLQAQLADHLNKASDNFQCEHRVRHRDGSYRWMLARGVAVWDPAGYASRIAGSFTDITERKRFEERLRHDALHDMLTGLGNRTMLLEHLAHVNELKKRRPSLLFALFFLDFDRFKQINDTLGHQAGDQLLIEAGRRLESGLRTTDTIVRYSGVETLARIAGDEFVILLEDIRSAEDVRFIADRIAELLNEPYRIGDRDVTLTASLGLVIPDAPYENPENIIRDADIAMYHAKQLGGGHSVLFTPEMYQGSLDRMQLESDLRSAVNRGEFEVYYQPVYFLDNDEIIGFEALVRWNHPQRGLLLPDEFIEIAEETGLISQIGAFVLEESCRRMRHWQSRMTNSTQLMLSVNLSPRQLQSEGLVETVSRILEKTGFDPRQLWLEVTEHTLLGNSEGILERLNGLRALGIRIEIDDFGTGFSSFRYLQDLPVEGFKIDRAFIQDIENGSQQIVKTLVDLAGQLGLFQVAEGIETEDQKEYLKSISCHYAQGHLMSRAITAEAVDALLDAICTAN